MIYFYMTKIILTYTAIFGTWEGSALALAPLLVDLRNGLLLGVLTSRVGAIRDA